MKYLILISQIAFATESPHQCMISVGGAICYAGCKFSIKKPTFEQWRCATSCMNNKTLWDYAAVDACKKNRAIFGTGDLPEFYNLTKPDAKRLP